MINLNPHQTNPYLQFNFNHTNHLLNRYYLSLPIHINLPIISLTNPDHPPSPPSPAPHLINPSFTNPHLRNHYYPHPLNYHLYQLILLNPNPLNYFFIHIYNSFY